MFQVIGSSHLEMALAMRGRLGNLQEGGKQDVPPGSA